MDDFSTGNKEIDEALREFESKLKTQLEAHAITLQRPQMSGMVFWLIKHSRGLIKDQRHAEYVLLGFAITALAISGFLFFRDNGTPAGLQAPPGYTIVYPPNAPPRLEPISQ